VDVSENLPGLIARPGLTAWRPTVDRSAEVTYESFDDFLKASIDPAFEVEVITKPLAAEEYRRTESASLVNQCEIVMYRVTLRRILA